MNLRELGGWLYLFLVLVILLGIGASLFIGYLHGFITLGSTIFGVMGGSDGS